MQVELRPDSVLAGFILGVAACAGAVGLYQMLVSKGYSIAVELAEAGWTPAELRAHKKAAALLPWLQTMREPATQKVTDIKQGRK